MQGEKIGEESGKVTSRRVLPKPRGLPPRRSRAATALDLPPVGGFVCEDLEPAFVLLEDSVPNFETARWLHMAYLMQNQC